jgi:RNA polymerase sigma-70 factor (ECF subfamily)
MLAGARSGNPDSWRNLVRLYAPLVLLWCRRCGLSGPRSQDAEDVLQEVFATVSKRINSFSKDGKPAAFRRWLKAIFGYKIREYWGLQPSAPVDPSALAQVPAPESSSDPEATSDEIILLRSLLELIRLEFECRTWKAFWMVAAEQRPAKDVAGELGLSVPAVHTAKCRVLKRLREEAEALGVYGAQGEVVTVDVAVAAQREVTP